MSSLSKKIEDLMSAISFAEAGDIKTAGEILHGENSLCERLKKLRQKVDLTLDDIDNLTSKATTFSEAREVGKAEKIMEEVNTKLEGVKKIFQEISNVIRVPKVISGEDKCLHTSGKDKKYYYNYYKHKEANNGK